MDVQENEVINSELTESTELTDEPTSMINLQSEPKLESQASDAQLIKHCIIVNEDKVDTLQQVLLDAPNSPTNNSSLNSAAKDSISAGNSAHCVDEIEHNLSETHTPSFNGGTTPSVTDRSKESSPSLEASHPVSPGDPATVNTKETGEQMETTLNTFVLGGEPVLLTGSWKEFENDNFLRGCKWSPDGTCLLTCSDDDVMRLYNLPTELYSGATEKLPEMTPVLRMPHATGIYDYCWYPRMSSWEPTTCCFATSCKDQPIYMWDAFYGNKRASYIPYNHLDEVISPRSLAFSLDGEQLYAGFNKSIKVFHTSRPGRVCTSRSTYDKKNGGQPGIVSCIALHPTHPDTFALGSYSRSVALYADSTKFPIFTLTDLSSGVTHIQFTSDGDKLLIGYRKNNVISCWDLRYPTSELVSLEREVTTNQRVYFDQTSDGGYLLSGSTNGSVCAWSTDVIEESLISLSEGLLAPCLCFTAHNDSVTGCSVHPTLPLLATGSGQRSFPSTYDNDSSSDCDSVDSKIDCSVKIWSLL